MVQAIATKQRTEEIHINSEGVTLRGDLVVPARAQGVVLFAHGSGSSRHSYRNQFVAQSIRKSGAGTLLFDLLTEEEEIIDARNENLRFNIELLASRLMDATVWINKTLSGLQVGYFGASSGAAAALIAAAVFRDRVAAVVSRGGRPDLAERVLPRVKASTLLIVGGRDYPAIELSEKAYALMHCEKELSIVEGATHLFEEPGALTHVAELAANWFTRSWKSND